MHLKSLAILIISQICLSGCNAPEIKDTAQCSPNIVLIEDNGVRYIDEENSVCSCRMYRWNAGYVGPIGQTEEFDISHCNKLVGHPPDEYLTVAKWYEAMRKYLSNKKAKN